MTHQQTDDISPDAFASFSLNHLKEVCAHCRWFLTEVAIGPTAERAKLKLAFADAELRRREEYISNVIAPAVTSRMRQAAIDYWVSQHPKSSLIPVGEINGILYAALNESSRARDIAEKGGTL